MGWLEELGVNVPNALAGFSGGLVNIFVFQRIKPLEAAGSIVAATFTANYLGQVASDYTHLPPAPTGFIVGLCAMQVCLGIVAAAKMWKPQFGGNKNDAP